MKPRLSFQSRLLGVTVLVVLLTLAFVAFLLQRPLRDQGIAGVRDALLQETALINEIVSDRWTPASTRIETDRLADELGQKLGMRVTLVSPDGAVLGDSELSPFDLVTVENHADRPEIAAALKQGQGWSVRHSATVRAELIYVAQLHGRPGHPELVLRLALSLVDFEKNMARVRRTIIWASLLGVLLSLVAAFILSHQITRPVRALTRTAVNISSGDLSQRSRRYPNHEIGDLGRAFDRMADHLQEEIEEVTWARDRLEAVLRGMVEGVLVIDAMGRITQANRALRELLDLRTNPLGRTPSEILRNADLIEAVQRVAAGLPYASLKIRTRGRIRRALEVEIAALPGDGSRAGMVAVFHDVTERDRIDRMRRDFVANVSHELRTPLAAIKGAVETLLGGALRDENAAKRFTETIHRQSARLEGIVLDLLELARLESGEETASEDDVPVRTLADACLAAVADLAASRGVSLETDLPEESFAIVGDHRQLEQAIVNLLDNAVKYTGEGGRVTLAAAKGQSEIRITVTDTGMGIPPEHHPRIFERFYRVDKNRSRELGGTGLGLAIVKHVAQAHGGRVEIESYPGRGSTFTLILPV